VHNFLTPMEACSACSGDYEDPDRSAWSDEEDEDAEEEAVASRKNELLAREKRARAEAEQCERS
jgi:hypothetical protein